MASLPANYSMRRQPRHLVLTCAFALGTLGAGHATAQGIMFGGGASAIGLITSQTHTPGNGTLNEGYFTQPILSGILDAGWLQAVGTLNLEGLTLRRGELDLGEWGEGYVDRRHPHAYLHELMLGAERQQRFGAVSLYGGRGFVPFGSDDPMVRPFESYPVDHHLAQILERVVVIGAARMGPVVAEASTFDGDEPIDPSTLPRFSRFGDSWAVRGTILGNRLASPLHVAELSASYAAVKSPEYRDGAGLDQRKVHAGLRLTGKRGSFSQYALLEAARTTEFDLGRALYTFHAILAEGALCRRDAGMAVRWERSDRPEEERLLDLFRSPRPATDVSLLGLTQWTTLTGAFALPAVHPGIGHAAPFVEVARLTVDRTTAALFDPARFYGATAMWRFSAGIRLAAGHRHDRMGRYGAARQPQASEHSGDHEVVAAPRCFT